MQALSPNDAAASPATPAYMHVRSGSASSLGSGVHGDASGGKTAEYAQLTQVRAGHWPIHSSSLKVQTVTWLQGCSLDG